MPTNSVKHEMLKLAKRIANTEYKDTIEEDIMPDGNLFKFKMPAKTHQDADINEILWNHPEFDAGRFRNMIKEFELRNIKKEDGKNAI